MRVRVRRGPRSRSAHRGGRGGGFDGVYGGRARCGCVYVGAVLQQGHVFVECGIGDCDRRTWTLHETSTLLGVSHPNQAYYVLCQSHKNKCAETNRDKEVHNISHTSRVHTRATLPSPSKPCHVSSHDMLVTRSDSPASPSRRAGGARAGPRGDKERRGGEGTRGSTAQPPGCPPNRRGSTALLTSA